MANQEATLITELIKSGTIFLSLQWRSASFPSGLNGHLATEAAEKESNRGQELWFNILHQEGRRVRPLNRREAAWDTDAHLQTENTRVPSGVS